MSTALYTAALGGSRRSAGLGLLAACVVSGLFWALAIHGILQLV